MKPLKQFGIALAIAVIVFSLLPVPAFASRDSTYVLVIVTVYHGSKQVEFYPTITDCSSHGYSESDACPVTVTIFGHRDYGRFLRWGGSDTISVSVPAGSISYSYDYYGPSTWYIHVEITLCGTDNCVVHQADTATMYFAVTVQLG